MPGTNQLVSQVFWVFCFFILHKRQIPASKTLASPRAHKQGLVPLGLPYRSVDRSQKKKEKKTKQHFKGLGDPPGFPVLKKKKKKLEQNRAELSSPADTCGSGGPRTLKCSQHPEECGPTISARS